MTENYCHDQCEDTFAEDTNPSSPSDLTARNSLVSPLFRLPAEIRRKIWEYAYGDIVVHVHERYTPEHGSHNVDPANYFEYRFYASNPCWTSGFEAGLKPVRRKIPLTTSPGTPAIAECPNCCRTHSADHLQAKLPLVSRQFWYEALSAFTSSLTLRFSCATVFDDWSRLEQRLAKQVRGLEIRMTRLSDWRTDHPYWGLVLHDESLAAFEKLRGLHLLVQIGHVDTHRLHDDCDVVDGPMWNMTELPDIIRAFQRRRLDRHLTSVALLTPQEPYTVENYNHLCENSDRKLTDAVCRALLDHPSHEAGDE